MSKRRSLTILETLTGTVIATVRTSAPAGWLLFNGDTMGSASSGATRASADHEELFKVLWDSFTNTDAPVSGGRGASAAADWSANKTITLPDLRGRSIIGTGTGSGLTARTHGAKVGAETHTLAESEMPAHAHNVSFGTTTPSAVDTSGSNEPRNPLAYSAGASLNVASQSIGTGAAHNNMQPSMALNWLVKI